MKTEFRERVLTYIGGGFGLVAGLAWNDAISDLIAYLFPLSADGIIAKLVYALILTVLVVAVISTLGRVFSGRGGAGEVR